MTFGTKLYNLRKTRGMSQEDLASELNTSRQAVSKWETDKGFPETDTLLMISNLFNVTIDSLLKDDGSAAEEGNGQGYYASRECVQGFLSFERRKIKLITTGISIILSGAIPTLLPDDFIFRTAFTIMLVFMVSAVSYLPPSEKIGTKLFEKNRYTLITRI